jgi:hypothetical protein
VLVLALKLFLAPACVVAVSLAGRRWGPTAAGLLGGFPVVAGPILLVVTIVQGSDFGADAAAGTLLGLTGVAASVVVYARAAPRLSPALTLLAAWATFFAVIALLGTLDVSPVVAFLIAVASLELGRLLVRAHEELDPADLPMPWWDLPARALTALLLVLAVTIAADALGPTLSGQLAAFPVLASVLLVFTHLTRGAVEVQLLTRAFLLGFYGFAVFSLVLALALDDLSTALSFALATVAAMALQLAMTARVRRTVSGRARLPRSSPLPEASSTPGGRRSDRRGLP